MEVHQLRQRLAPLPKEDGTLKHVPGSNAAFTLTQGNNCYGPADWFPEDHPAMPDVVSHGRKLDVTSCGFCHYPNGKSRPENAGISGLPVAYFVQQMNDFKNGVRKSAEPRKANTYRMIGFAKALSDDEIKAAAEYFAPMKWTSWVKVTETTSVPKTPIAGGMFAASGRGRFGFSGDTFLFRGSGRKVAPARRH